jgi:VanZ like family/Concanavalin A-like lectin/glucanases superfamily
MLLRAVCLLLLLGILAAGLWPLYVPRNEVNWSPDVRGILFGEYGSVISAGLFVGPGAAEGKSCSFEVWLGPKLDRPLGTVFSFYSHEHHATTFLLRQAWGYLALQRRSANDGFRLKRSRISVGGLYGTATPVLITVTSGQGTTSLYADGKLVKSLPGYAISSDDLTGRLIAGNAARSTSNWAGQLSGLAIYDRELTAEEVSRHYDEWSKQGQLPIRPDERAIALYLFREGSGTVVQNQVDSATDLVIPNRFFVVDKRFLEPPWQEFRWDTAYFQDIIINVAGFVPLGFFFYAYFLLLRKMEHPTRITIAFGFLVSLFIEISQAFLPTRNSGMTDLITNSLGTAIGAVLCGWNPVEKVLRRVGLGAVETPAPQ